MIFPYSRSVTLALALIVAWLMTLLSGCATQSQAVVSKESPQSQPAQVEAQAAALAAENKKVLGLKRKLALGRISNETLHGKSLLRTNANDVLGKQVTDLLSKTLAESGQFLVFERPDIHSLKNEAQLSGVQFNVVGVDALIIGSLTEFGRKTTGKSGFLSSTKKQTATAKVDLRVVDTKTGQIIKAFSGAGEASLEAGTVAGFGSRASYDASLNDRAVATAVADAVDKLIQIMSKRPWQSDILQVEGQQVFVAGGELQGIKPGMIFDVVKRGKKVKSQQTGFVIQLPGKKVAQVEVSSLFGDSESNQGSIATITSGSIQGFKAQDLVVQERK